MVQSQQELGEEVACLLFAEGQGGLEVPPVRALWDPLLLLLALGLRASSVDPDLRTYPLMWGLVVPEVEAARIVAYC